MLRPGERCPTSRDRRINNGSFTGIAIGAGPVHPLGASNVSGAADLISNTQHAGWLAFKGLWFSEPRYKGPFLVRLRRLGRPGPVGVLEDPGKTSFFTPAGPTINSYGGYRTVPGSTWVKKPGCIAWQVDGLGFSHVIVVRAVCRPGWCTRRRD